MKIVGFASAASLFLLIASASSGSPQTAETMTPLLLAVQDAPIPFTGSDGRTHLVYELGMTNFSSAPIAVEKVEVMGDGATLETLDTAAVTERLQPAGQRESAGLPGTCVGLGQQRQSRRLHERSPQRQEHQHEDAR